MINSVGQNISAALEASKLREGGKTRAAAAVSNTASTETATTTGATSPAARMAAEGAPIDLDRIASIKAAISSGNYPVNPAAIADKMLELDLPVAN